MIERINLKKTSIRLGRGSLGWACSCCLLLWLSMSVVAAPDDWTLLRSENFELITDGDPERCVEILRQLEAISQVFKQVYPQFNFKSGHPFLVVAARHHRSSLKFIPDGYRNTMERQLSGMFVSTENRSYLLINLGRGRSINSSITHEFVHYVNQLNYGRLPLWLNEGLAEYFRSLDVSQREVTIGLPPASYRQQLTRRRMMPMDTFFSHKKWHEHGALLRHSKVFYLQSWAMVHWLFHDEQARANGTFEMLIKRLADNEPVDHVVAEELGDHRELYTKLKKHIHRRFDEFQTITLPAAPEQVPIDTRPLEAGEAAARLAMFQTAMQRTRRAERMIRKAKKLAPDAAITQQARGDVAMLQGDFREARKAYRLALDQEPGNAQLLFSWSRTFPLYFCEPAELDQVASVLKQAIQINPSLTSAYTRLGIVEALRGKDETTVMAFFEEALRREKGQPHHRVKRLEALIALGHLRRARALAMGLLPEYEGGPLHPKVEGLKLYIEGLAREQGWFGGQP